MNNLGIFYATTGGNTRLVAQFLAERFEKSGLKSEIFRLETAKWADFDQFSHLIFASPTYGHGQLDPKAEIWKEKWEKMSVSLSKKPFSVIGLGNHKYDEDYTIESAQILADFFQKKDGKLIFTPLKVDGHPILQLKTKINDWGNDFLQKTQKKG